MPADVSCSIPPPTFPDAPPVSAGEAGERRRPSKYAQGSHVILDAMTGIGGRVRYVASPVRLRLLGLVGGCLTVRPAEYEPSADLPLVVAIDAGPGVGVNDGSLPGPSADVTVTFGAMKPCAMVPPASIRVAGEALVDFGSTLTIRFPRRR